MTSLTNYDELKTEIQAWLEREGEPALVARLDTIIQLAESWLNRKLNGYQREVSSTLTTDARGMAALPAGAVSVKSVTYLTRPYGFALSGNTLSIADGASRTFDVVYRSRLTALGSGNASNWLLQIAPDAYLQACLGQASLFLENVQMAAVYRGEAAEILKDLNLQSIAAQYGMASLTIPGQVP